MTSNFNATLDYRGERTTPQSVSPTVESLSPAPTSVAPESCHLVCFSHLRWKFVYQQRQHLLSRASRHWPVWFVEEPIWGDTCGLEVTSLDQLIENHLLALSGAPSSVRNVPIV